MEDAVKALAISIVLLLASGCSWITSKRSLFGDEGEAVSNTSNVVPKAQYDQLLNRYNSLLEQTKNLPAAPADAPTEGSDLVGELSQVKSTPSNPELAETVDVFAKIGNDTVVDTNSAVPSMISSGAATVVAPDYKNVDVEGQITTLRKAESLVYANRNDEALKLIKKIENSPVRQVAVRARFLLGELMFNQGEFDLSMQVYERILSQDAFSGVVLKTLGRLIVCSEKLGLNAKKDKYYSMLHDFFGA